MIVADESTRLCMFDATYLRYEFLGAYRPDSKLIIVSRRKFWNNRSNEILLDEVEQELSFVMSLALIYVDNIFSDGSNGRGSTVSFHGRKICLPFRFRGLPLPRLPAHTD